MSEIFSLASDKLPAGTHVVAFTGAEALSRLYRFDLHLVMPHDESEDFDMAAAVGATATLTLHDAAGGARTTFHGIVDQIEFVCDLSGDALYRATLVPKAWRLTQSLHSRVYIGKSVPEILDAALLHGGLTADDFVLRLSRSYHPLDHVCQYRESDFDFVSRWMEREGIYYHFEQGETRERMVVTDSKSYQTPFGTEPVRYFAQGSGEGSTVEAINTFTCAHRALPASVRLRDYDYLRPDTDVSGNATVSNGAGEVNLYAENFTDAAEGRRLASVRAQELTARQVVYEGRGRVYDLRPGYTMELEDHPRAAFNRRYLVTALEHRGNQFTGAPEMRRALADHAVQLDADGADDVYRVRVTAIADDVQFRPVRVTPWPRIYGTEIGVIDGGLTSDHAQIDTQGRYLVKILFDESDLHDGKASMRLRMLQPHGGNPEGFHFPLRKGTEVLLTFLGGDPDRPVIVGVVPNALNPSPVTQDNHMLNVIHTGGNNHIEISDIPGREYIKFKTPHARTVFHIGARHNPTAEAYKSTEGSSKSIVGVDQVAFVGHSRCAVIGEATEGTTKSGDSDAASKFTSGSSIATFRSSVLASFADSGGSDATRQNQDLQGTAQEGEGDNDGTHASGARDINESLSSPFDAPGDSTMTLPAGSDVKIVAADYWSYLGGDRKAVVDGSQYTHISGHQTTNVDTGRDTTITGDYTSTVKGSRSNTVTGHKHVVVGAGQDSTITGFQTSTVNGDQTSNVYGHKSATVTGGQETHIQGFQQSDLQGSQISSITGAQISAVTLKDSFTGIALGITGLKMEVTVLNLSTNVFALKTATLHVIT